MYLSDYFKQAIYNINRKKARFVLSIMSISIGVATVVFITSAGNSGLITINNEFGKMGLNCCVIKGESNALDTEDIIAVQNSLSDRYYTSTVVKSSAEINMENYKKEAILYGGDEEILSVFNYKIINGRNIRLDDLINNKKVVIIDNVLSYKLYGTENSTGKKLKMDIGEIDYEFTVVGITDSSSLKNTFDDEMPIFLFVPHTTVSELTPVNIPAEIYTLSQVETNDNLEIKNVVKLINDKKSQNGKLIYKNMNAYKNNIDYVAKTITLILAMIGAISLVSGGLGVVNTMMMAVSERKGEIGIKKALGQTDCSVVSELVTEAVITMAIACILGVLSGLFISYSCLKLYDIVFIPDYKSVIVVTIISLFMGIVFGFLPALKTFSMNPVEILK